MIHKFYYAIINFTHNIHLLHVRGDRPERGAWAYAQRIANADMGRLHDDVGHAIEGGYIPNGAMKRRSPHVCSAAHYLRTHGNQSKYTAYALKNRADLPIGHTTTCSEPPGGRRRRAVSPQAFKVCLSVVRSA